MNTEAMYLKAIEEKAARIEELEAALRKSKQSRDFWHQRFYYSGQRAELAERERDKLKEKLALRDSKCALSTCEKHGIHQPFGVGTKGCFSFCDEHAQAFRAEWVVKEKLADAEQRIAELESERDFAIEIRDAIRMARDVARRECGIARKECAAAIKARDELKAKLDEAIARTDLHCDEFLRIKACPGANDEIRGLCDRALSDIRQYTLVLAQRDAAIQRAEKAEREREAAQAEFDNWRI